MEGRQPRSSYERPMSYAHDVAGLTVDIQATFQTFSPRL